MDVMNFLLEDPAALLSRPATPVIERQDLIPYLLYHKSTRRTVSNDFIFSKKTGTVAEMLCRECRAVNRSEADWRFYRVGRS